MTKKKILIISMAYYPRFIGGAEVAIRELTDRLGSEYEFHMVTLRYDKNLPKVSREGAVLVHRIGPGFSNITVSDLRKIHFRLLKLWFQCSAFLFARNLHKDEHFSCVWSMMAHSAGVPGGLFKRFHKEVPYVLTLQEGDPPAHIENQMRIFGSLFDDAFTRADIVQAISVFLGDWGMRMGAREVAVIPNGVGVARFSSETIFTKRTELREEFGVPQEAQLFITSSRLVPKNGIDLVIRALPFLEDMTHFLIAGAGPEKLRLQTLAQEIGVESRVHFAGEVSQKELPLYLGASDFFIRASRSEGQGIAFIEALAAGLPTIGTDVGGIPDFLHEGETGFLAETCDAQGVASAMLRALEDPAHTKEVAKRGQLLSKQYDWAIIAERMKREVFEPLWN